MRVSSARRASVLAVGKLSKVWGAWGLVALGWLIAHLPLRLLFPLGKALGRTLFLCGGRRRRITETNLRLCFPNLRPSEVQALAGRVFESVALGVLELCVVWLNPGRDLRRRVLMEGARHFHEAMAQGRGLLLLGGHFAALDICAPALCGLGPVDALYRANRNPVWERLQVQGRRRCFNALVERKDVRGALRSLKAGRALWYAPDQDYGPKHSVFAPFFGVPAATITAPARLAAANQTPVLMLSQHRNYAARTWTLRFAPPPPNFPSGDEREDAAAINQAIEATVRRRPEQYLWLHRRFKTRPPGEASLY